MPLHAVPPTRRYLASPPQYQIAVTPVRIVKTPTELVLHLSSKTLMPDPTPPPPPLVDELEPEPTPEPVRELVLA